MEAIEQPFATNVMFGGECQLTFNRTGDLLYHTYVLVDLWGIEACRAGVCTSGDTIPDGTNLFVGNYPGLPAANYCDPCNDNPATGLTVNGPPASYPDGVEAPWAHYTNSIGQWIVRRASIIIGGQVIDQLFSEYLFMWEELSGKPGKRLEEMIGKDEKLEDLVANSMHDRRLYVPLPFWFSQPNGTGNALPMVSLQFHGVQLSVCFQELSSCIQTSCARNEDGQMNSLYVIKRRSRQPISDQDLRASVETTYVYLDIDERDRFATGAFEQLICQTQVFTGSFRQSQVRVMLNFNHPMIELIWAVRRQCMSHTNNHFAFDGRDGQDPIRAVSLKLNNLPRFSSREARYFRLVQPWMYHTNIPKHYIYCYSFALYPEEPQPSGSCNFSRIDNVELVFEMQTGIDQFNEIGSIDPSTRGSCNIRGNTGEFTIIVYGRSWNILRYREGLGGLAFSN